MTFHSFYFLGRRRESYGPFRLRQKPDYPEGHPYDRESGVRGFGELVLPRGRGRSRWRTHRDIRSRVLARLHAGIAAASQRHRDIQQNTVRIGKTVLGPRRENGGAIASLSALEIVGIEDDEFVASTPSEARSRDLAVSAILLKTRK